MVVRVFSFRDTGAEFCSSCWGRSWKTRRQTSTDKRLESVVHQTETGQSQGCGEFGLAFWLAIPGTWAWDGWSTVCCGCSEVEQNVLLMLTARVFTDRKSAGWPEQPQMRSGVLCWGWDRGSPDGGNLGLRGSISWLNEEKRDSQMLGTEQALAAGEPGIRRFQRATVRWLTGQDKKWWKPHWHVLCI